MALLTFRSCNLIVVAFALLALGCSRGSQSGQPLAWRLGRLDSRFHVSEAQAEDAVKKAVSLWEDAAGKQLFRYDEQDGFPVNFMHDARQDRLLAEAKASTEIRREEKRVEDQKKKMDAANISYTKARDQEGADVEALNSRIEGFNSRMAPYRGPAEMPADIRADLRAEEQTIEKAEREVSAERRQTDRLRAAANRIIDRHNSLVLTLNGLKKQFNRRFVTGGTQVLGECILNDGEVKEVNVYAFVNQDHLAVVLAHEFGHALGLPHVPGKGSIMGATEKGEEYPTVLRLSDADKRALKSQLQKQVGG